MQAKQSYRTHMTRVLVSLVIPQGYTLSVAGGFASAVAHYGYPSYGETVGFVGGAVLAFIVLATLGEREREADHLLPELPVGPRALFNVVALAAVPLAAAGCYAIPWPPLGFIGAGLMAVGGYAALVAAFFTFFQTPTASRHDPHSAAAESPEMMVSAGSHAG